MEPEAGGSLGSRTMKAAVALLVRQGATNGLAAGAGILLARLLAPADFGLYAVAAFVLTFAAIFADAGLAASLVRQSSPPTTHEIRAVFTAQQILVLSIVAALWLAAPLFASWYGLPPSQAWFFRILSLTLVFGSFQTIPSLLLERSLDFNALAKVEILQSVVYQGSMVLAAWKGWGAWSFALAGVLRAVVGASAMAALRPWPIGWSWDWAVAAPRLRFGLMLQGSSLVNVTKDSIVPIFLGLLAGPSAVGLVGWAGTIAAYPILALMPLGRLYFPVFARMQHDREALARAMERIIGWTNRIAAPVTVVMLVLSEPMTRIVYTAKWLPALDLMRMLALANLLSATATPCLGMLNGLGLPHLSFRMSVLWLVATWIVGAPMILWLGTLGFGVANLAATSVNLYLFRMCRKEAPFRILPAIGRAWSAAFAAGLATFAATLVVEPTDFPRLLLCGAVGGATHVAVVWATERDRLRDDWSQFRHRGSHA